MEKKTMLYIHHRVIDILYDSFQKIIGDGGVIGIEDIKKILNRHKESMEKTIEDLQYNIINEH